MTDSDLDPRSNVMPPDSGTLLAALAQAEAAGDLAAQNVLLGQLGRAYLDEDETLLALARFEQGLKVAQQLDDKESGARHLANQGVALAQIGNYALAMRAFRKAFAFVKDIGHEPMEYELLMRMAELERARQNPESAVGHLDEALALAERHQSLNRMLRVRLAYGRVSHDLDELEEAVRHYQTALSLARQVDDTSTQVECLNLLGGLARVRRDTTAAADYFEQALSLAPSALTVRQKLALMAQLADIRFAQGDLETARQLFSEAVAAARELGDLESEARLIGSLGLIVADQGNAELALSLAERAVALAREIGDPRLQGEQLLFQSMALSDHGRDVQALEACDAAIALFESIEASSLVQKAYELREKLVSEPADDAEDL